MADNSAPIRLFSIFSFEVHIIQHSHPVTPIFLPYPLSSASLFLLAPRIWEIVSLSCLSCYNFLSWQSNFTSLPQAPFAPPPSSIFSGGAYGLNSNWLIDKLSFCTSSCISPIIPSLALWRPWHDDECLLTIAVHFHLWIHAQRCGSFQTAAWNQDPCILSEQPLTGFWLGISPFFALTILA